MSTNNICFCGEIRKKYQYFWIEKSALTSAMIDTKPLGAMNTLTKPNTEMIYAVKSLQVVIP